MLSLQSKKSPVSVATLLVALALQFPIVGLAASDGGQQTAGVTAGRTESGYGQIRRVWVLTTDNRPASEVDPTAPTPDETPMQYELKCEAGHLQSAQRSYSGTGYGQDRTWTVTVNRELLSRGGSSVLNYALETVCGV